MKTTDFTAKVSSSKLRENMNKMFGVNVDFNKYSREQLEDMRNKLRTRVFQQEGQTGINDLLTNETYQKDKAMLALLNTRIKEMLGEDIAKLRDKLAQLDEAKKGVRAPKFTKKAAGAKPDFLDMDKDGDKKEPMKKAVADKKDGPKKGVNPFAKVKEGAKPDFLDMDKDGNKKEPMKKAVADKKANEGFPTVADAKARHEKEKTTGKFDKKETSTGTVYTKKHTKADAEHKPEKKVKEAVRVMGRTGEGEPMKRMAKGTAGAAAHRDATAAMTKQARAAGSSMRKDSAVDVSRSGKHPDKQVMKYSSKDVAETSHQEKTTMKHVKNPTAGEKKAAKDIKPGIKGYSDRVAMLKSAEKDGRLKESNLNFKYAVRAVNEGLARLLREDEEGKAKAITASGDIVNDYTSWMQRVGQYQTKTMIELADAIKADFGAAEAEAFKQAVGPALNATLETLTQQREAISNAVAALAGEEPAATDMMGAEPMPEPGMEPAAPDEMNAEPAGDEFGAADAAAGAGTPGREVRESKFARRLAESHSIMSKLAR